VGSVEGAQRILSGLKEAGIDVVASVPDINVLELINLLYESRDITHIPVGREEEGIGVCTGAYLGGRHPARTAAAHYDYFLDHFTAPVSGLALRSSDPAAAPFRHEPGGDAEVRGRESGSAHYTGKYLFRP